MKSCLALCLSLALTSAALCQGTHKDDELGFQFRPVAKWKKIPIPARELWIVAKYQSEREYSDKTEGYRHRPDMQIILFPEAVVKDRGVKVTKTGENTLTVRSKNPYKDFKEYLRANSQGGYYISEEREDRIDDVAVTCLEIRYEKLTVPRRALAWIFHGDDADWAVYYEGLEDYWQKLVPDFERSLRSFKFIRRTGSLVRGATTGGGDVEIDISKELTPAEQAEKRDKKFDVELAASTKSLEKGWRVQKSKNYVALTHVDQKYTKRVLDHAEAIRAWLEDNFGFLEGPDAGKVVFRICESDSEWQAFAGMGSAWGGAGREVATYKDVSGGRQSFEAERVNGWITSVWFRDKNLILASGMPSWLQYGLRQVLGTSVAKGRRLEFKPDEWEVTRLRETARNDKLALPQEMIKARWEDFARTENAVAQAGVFVRFLIEGPRSKTQGFLEKYLTNLVTVLDEEEKREKEELKKRVNAKEETEEEQEARFKARQQAEKKYLEEVFNRTFADWSENDWKKFDRAYMEFVK